MTNYLEDELLDHAIGKTSFTMPTATYVVLFTADPTEAGSFTNEVPNSNGYARQQITAANWTASSGGATSNAAAVTFTASGNWTNPVTHMGIADSGTHGAGNLLFWDDITSTVINNGDSLTFAIGAIDITLD